MLSLLYKYFPPPAYLSMPAFGLDISDETLKFITLRHGAKGIEVDQFGRKAIPPGLIVSGEIKKPEELSALLKEVCKPLGMKYVYLTLPEEKGYMNIVKLPPMADAEIRTALEAQFSDYVPLPLNEALFDFEILHTEQRGIPKKHREIAMVSFPRRLIENYYPVWRRADLQPLAFDAEVQALSRAVIPQTAFGSFMIVDFGKTRTSFIIVAENQVPFYRPPVDLRDYLFQSLIEVSVSSVLW